MPTEVPGNSSRRVAITGVGLVTPLGLTREASWEGLLTGRRSIDWLTPPNGSGSAVAKVNRAFGGRVNEPTFFAGRLFDFADRAVREAIEHAQLTSQPLSAAGCVIGTSKIDLQQFDKWQRQTSAEAAQSHVADILFPSTTAAKIAAKWGWTGPVLCPVAACATGLVSLIRGAELIRSGDCDVVLAGSADASLHPGLLASYRRLGVLAKPGDSPGEACRPFDRDRTGFAVGEGAGILVMEDWEHARQRQAPLLAEWIDGCLGSDPTGLTSLDTSGAALAAVVQRLLDRRRLTSAVIDLVSVHGTATQLNDRAEGAGLRRIFRGRISPVPAFGIKGAIGHLMGAAGAVETAASVLSLAQGIIPPTVNHEHPQDSEALAFFNRADSPERLHCVLKVSLGFGGTIATALLARPDGRETA